METNLTMSENQQVKVYELAKELGLDSISLLDKLGELNIKVKNHMSDLKPEEADAARSAILKKSESRVGSKAKTTTKTTRTVTRTAAKTETKSTSTAETAKKVAKTKKKSDTAAASTQEAPSTQASNPTQSAASATSSTIIRRRISGESADGTVTMETVTKVTKSKPSATAPTGQSANLDAIPATEGKLTHPSETSGIVQESAPLATESDPHSDSEAKNNLAKNNLERTQAENATTSSVATTVNEVVETKTTTTSTTTEVKVKPSIVLAPRPVAPKKTFLKIVEPTPPPKPNIVKAAPITPSNRGPSAVGGGPADREGFRIIKMTKENLDQMQEEENSKKKGLGKTEGEIRPEDVRFADYRKKEMVFLPRKKRLPIGKEIKRTQITTPKAAKRVVEMQATISVQELANQLNVKAGEVIKKLMMMGQMATINQALDFDTATLLAQEYQYEVKNVSFKEEALLDVETDKEEDMEARPPVVTIMGHVDHGKTSLLDAIREAKVAAGEAGGITQHIGAYTVTMNGKKITFIDTPGHEAFTVMRARGANVTDIVILVVAADDGVMPQTREALSHAKAAGVPIIVAVNKIDKPGANPEKIKQQLAELDLLAEDWGGQTIYVPVSAIKRTNLDTLLESILLQAEVLDLKANFKARASGTVLETRLEKGKGPVVSLLVKKGTLRVGDWVVSGQALGKVKAMMDHLGRAVKEVTPGTAAEILGFETLPNAGERYDGTASDADARQIVQNRIEQSKANQTSLGVAAGKNSLEALFSKIQTGNLKELPIVLKADVFGSVEAIRDSLAKLSNEKVKVKVIHSAPGGITESDVLLASASNAIILGFNVRPETKARQVAESAHIEIKTYNIIYELIDDVKLSMIGLLDKKKVERFLGRAEVRQIFTVPKVGTIAGSFVIDGKIVRGANVRLLRDSRIIYDGKMSSLKRFKDDAKEVAQGYECGISLENYNDLKPNDLIEAYQIDLVAGEMDS